MWFWRHLSFSIHVKVVTKSAYYHLQNIARIRCFVSSQDLFMSLSPAGWIIVLFSFPRRALDSCSSSRTLLQDPDQNQNIWTHHTSPQVLTRASSPQVLTRASSPQVLTLASVTFWIDFKVLLLVYKSLNGLGPKYITDMLTEYKPNRPLRSLGSSPLEIPRVHTKQGESAFSYYAARSWNQLPEEIRCAKTLATFKSRFKTHLFSCAFTELALLCPNWLHCIICIIIFISNCSKFILNTFFNHFKHF